MNSIPNLTRCDVPLQGGRLYCVVNASACLCPGTPALWTVLHSTVSSFVHWIAEGLHEIMVELGHLCKVKKRQSSVQSPS